MRLLEGVPGSERLVDRLRQEEELAVRDIREGRFQRSMALITVFSAVVSGWEAYSQHLRGAFSHWLMWTPVALAVPTVLAATATIFSQGVARLLLALVSLVSMVDGIVGFLFHLRGIRRLPGGFRIGQYNVVFGPPIFAPLLLCSVGILGLLASVLRPERLTPPRWDQRPASGVAEFVVSRTRPRGFPWGLAWQISHGRFQRGMALTSAFFALLSGGEVYFEHLRGSFNQRWMWTPVWITPPMIAAALGAVRSKGVAQRLLPLASMVAFLEGLLGFGLHLRGVHRMPGGFSNLHFNVTYGPPLFAPLLFTSVGLLGFIAALLRPREG